MKNRVLAAIILLLPVGLFLFFWVHPPTEKAPPTDTFQTPPAQAAAVAKALASQSDRTTGLIASNFAKLPQTIFYSSSPKSLAKPAGNPKPLEFTNVEPAIVLENMGRAIRQYGSMFGGNPVGTNPEITSQLSGKNPKHINFLKPEAGMRVNEAGELIDPWGTPYFFHQLSGTDTEIRCAGPDRIMWTSDDLVIK